MAEHNYWIGSHGPYYYDDADLHDTGDSMEAVYSNTGGFNVNTGQVQTAPTAGPDVVRFADLPWPINPTFVDVTALRVVGTTYQNSGSSFMICQISVNLNA